MEDPWGLFSSMDGDAHSPVLSGVSKVLLHLVDPMDRGAIGRGRMHAASAENAGVVARFEFQMTNDGFDVGVVNTHQAGVPTDTDLVTNVFRWDFIVGAGKFDVAVSVDGALSFLEVVESFRG